MSDFRNGKAEKIKQHIKEHGHETNFEVTESMCLYWWRRLNNAAFDSKLKSPIRFECKNYRHEWGWVYPWRKNRNERRVRIGMGTQFRSREHFFMVLAHEMVHQWEWEIARLSWPRVTKHGSYFKDKAIRVGKLLELSIEIQ